jgi:hypothetical protein
MSIGDRSNGIRAIDDVLLLCYHKNANVLVQPLSLLRVQLCEKERIPLNSREQFKALIEQDMPSLSLEQPLSDNSKS